MTVVPLEGFVVVVVEVDVVVVDRPAEADDDTEPDGAVARGPADDPSADESEPVDELVAAPAAPRIPLRAGSRPPGLEPGKAGAPAVPIEDNDPSELLNEPNEPRPSSSSTAGGRPAVGIDPMGNSAPRSASVPVTSDTTPLRLGTSSAKALVGSLEADPRLPSALGDAAEDARDSEVALRGAPETQPTRSSAGQTGQIRHCGRTCERDVVGARCGEPAQRVDAAREPARRRRERRDVAVRRAPT